MAEIGDHLNPTEEVALETVKSRAVKGVFALTGRTFIFSIISLVATGLLTVFLEPAEFGIFWIVSALVNFLNYFSDVGLAAALIQKKEEVTADELKTTFTIQQIIVVTLLLGLFFATPLIARFYGLDRDGIYLMYALGASLFMSSLKTIPSVLLERELRFGKLVLPQVLENLVYNIVAVLLAWQGFGVQAFTFAVLIRGIFGLIAIYILRPWMPGVAFSKRPIKKLLGFGIPYQANTLLATIKDDGMTIFLGGILGPAGIGLLGWAQKWGQAPLRFFMDHILKVTFPAFSRMQDKNTELERSVTRSIFFICSLVFPTVVGLIILAPILIEVVPRYEKWRPALLPLAFISINTVIAAATTQLTNLFNSIGKIKITFKLMIMWVVLTWAIIPWMARRYGVEGAALGYAMVSASSVVAVIIARKFVKYSLMISVVKPFAASAVMGIVLLYFRKYLPYNITTVGILIATGAVVYLAIGYVIIGRGFVNDVEKSLKRLLKIDTK